MGVLTPKSWSSATLQFLFPRGVSWCAESMFSLPCPMVHIFNQWLASRKLAVCYGSYGIAGPFIDDLWWFTKGSTFFCGFWNLNPWPYAWSHYRVSLEWQYFGAEGGQNGQAGLWMFPKSLGCPIAVFFWWIILLKIGWFGGTPWLRTPPYMVFMYVMCVSWLIWWLASHELWHNTKDQHKHRQHQYLYLAFGNPNHVETANHVWLNSRWYQVGHQIHRNNSSSL